MDQFSQFFSLLNSSRICGGRRNYTPPLKSYLCHTTLRNVSLWSTIQLYSTVNSVQSDEKRLIMVNVHEGYAIS